MKILYIALKDLTRSFRSLFLLAFMFVIPLLVTGMFSLMFGGPAAADPQSAAPALAPARLVIVNLDEGSRQPAPLLEALGPGGPASLGQVLAAGLQAPALSGLLEVTLAGDALAARQAVQDGKAAAALLIPANFSAAYLDPQGQVNVELYTDPAQPAAAAVIQGVLGSSLDSFSGLKIALELSPNPAGPGGAAGQYLAWSATAADPASLLDRRMPSGAPQAGNPLGQILAPIMAGMLVFFAFFTGAASAQSILTEQEEGTLARLFSTPTPVATILWGKFLAVGLTVLVQVTVVLGASALFFHIQWGALGTLALAGAGIVTCATMFGIFLNSFLKDTRQAGVVFGSFLTVTGMLAMLGIFTGGGAGASAGLFVPQGWALRGLLLSLEGAPLGDLALNLLSILAWSAVFFGAGLLKFQKRFGG